MTTPAGPGKFSKRTDKAVGEANRSLPNAGYGEQAQYQEQLQGAPMAQDPAAAFTGAFGSPAGNVTPINAPSAYPEEPVTTGAATGPGAGPEVLGQGADQNAEIDKLRAYLPALQYMADAGNSDAARNLVRQIQAMAG